jgi:hypothetical protein
MDDLVWTLMVLAFLAGLYFLPWIVANQRKVPNEGSIAVLNIFLGWTLVGWVVALAMAARSMPKAVSTDSAEGAVSPRPSESQPPKPVSADAGSSMASELAKIADLRERGVLSEDEFQRAKSRLLD